MKLVAEVEQALGPGVDFERDGASGWVARRARPGSMWLGFDRAAVVDSDDGSGRRVPILVALPASTFAGARLAIEVVGGWCDGTTTVLVGSMSGSRLPAPELARLAAGLDGHAAWLDQDAAEREARLAYQRYRERRSHARIGGGRAWNPAGALPPELARFATPHSLAEYRLGRLPPRFVRALEGLLDDDERILYWVERPVVTDVGLAERLRGRLDRRAALLLLTDRQLLWIVDHAQPDRYLEDWGVDVDLVPVERVTEARCERRAGVVRLVVDTGAGSRAHDLPAELGDEVGVMRDLLARFTPVAGGLAPRRRYPVEPIEFDPAMVAPFRQEADARRSHERAAARGEVSAFLYSPSRPGQRRPAALILRPSEVELDGQAGSRTLPLGDVTGISLTLSTLVCRLSLGPGMALTCPAPLGGHAASFVRLARRAIGNAA